MDKDGKAWGSFLGILAMGGVSLLVVFAVGVGILIGHYAIGPGNSSSQSPQPAASSPSAGEEKRAEEAVERQREKEAIKREAIESEEAKAEEEAEAEEAKKEEEAAAGKSGANAPSGGGEAAAKSKSTSKAPASGTAVAQGEQIFKSTCSACHTLAAAKTTGTVGPDLDQLKPNYETVHHQVTFGGGVMPAFGKEKILTEAEVEAVAKYVSTVAGKS